MMRERRRFHVAFIANHGTGVAPLEGGRAIE
jgi:hypothetical protein